MKHLWIGVGALVLAGCAATPKPVMGELEYHTFTHNWVALQQCINSGEISPELGALGTRYMQAELHQWQYDNVLFNTQAGKINQSGRVVSSAQCKQYAVAIADQRNQIEIGNQVQMESQRQIENVLNQPSNHVFCNTVGGVTMCNDGI